MPADRQSSRPWIGPVIGVVLVLTAVGGLVARSIYQPAANATTPQASSAPPPTTGGSTTPGAPLPEPGSDQVQLSADAAATPYGAAMQGVLQTYYEAINNRVYAEWESVVTPAFIAQYPKATWQNNYVSTKDGSVYVYRINAAPGGQLRVLLTFTSTQDHAHEPQAAPYTCTVWHSVLPVVNTKGSWKIDLGSNGTHPPVVPCPS